MRLGKEVGLKMEEVRVYFEIRTEFLYTVLVVLKDTVAACTEMVSGYCQNFTVTDPP